MQVFPLGKEEEEEEKEEEKKEEEEEKDIRVSVHQWGKWDP